MKFAKELEQDLVPEWRIKYLNYKAGKKHIKAITKAINRVNSTPHSLGSRRGNRPTPGSTFAAGTPFAFSSKPRGGAADAHIENNVDPVHTPHSHGTPSGSGLARPIPRPRVSEVDPLTEGPGSDMQYGSFVPTPPSMSPAGISEENRNVFELPAPAMRTPSLSSMSPKRPNDSLHRSFSRQLLSRSMSMVMGGGGDQSKGKGADEGVLMAGGLAGDRETGTPGGGQRAASIANPGTPSNKLRRIFTTGSRTAESPADIGLQNLNVVRERQQAFFGFMDSELNKVEKFYRSKEEHAARRLALLREQLHEMRNRRIQEINAARERREAQHEHEHGVMGAVGHSGKQMWLNPLRPSTRMLEPGPNSRALQKMAQTPVFGPGNERDARRDYIRRPEAHEVPYRTAKRKLKLALQEFYRGLELLKAYALLNRTAFRKLNKKYDKAVRARPPYRYMNEKVGKAYFVTSDVLDTYIQTVEDLYARYFEKGNRKVAVGKLRSLARRRPGDESASAFRNGVFMGTGLVFAIQGLYFAGHLLFGDDDLMRQRTSFLLQIYGGYFLMLFLFMLFCVDCYVWTRCKVNYPFIFELDPRHNLDWRQLAEFPSFMMLLFGFVMWLNFVQAGPAEMYLYYPVILIGVTALIILLPAPVLYHRSRSWFAYSHYRLLLAGIYPVEFRDFFLGDIYCSLTYATCNVELFFCLYANHWENPPQCNSKHSRLLGFFGALPPIWRFLQCIRRYKDTRNIFPHVVNCGKYSMSILAAVTLSVYRIVPVHSNLAAFLLFASINAVYCSIWDLFMDFSLMQTSASKFLLRDITALKQPAAYYIIMVADVCLRFSWIFYAIFTHDAQHSTLVSFFVSFAEVLRRGMWALIRVENEHCGNVAQYKASRDIPLPYDIEPTEHGNVVEASPLVGPPCDDDNDNGEQQQPPQRRPWRSEEVRVEQGQSPGVTRMGTPRTFSKMVAEAHKQDFVKKRRPTDDAEAAQFGAVDEDDEDEDEEDEEEDEEEAGVGEEREVSDD